MNNYILYTEEYLWSKKLTKYYENANRIKLNAQEKQIIFKACQNSNIKKVELIKRYIKYITKEKSNIIHLSDTDIKEIMKEGRDLSFKSVDLTIEKIVENIKTTKDIDLLSTASYIEEYSLVWTLFTGIFWNLMYKKNIIKTNKILITAPWDMVYPNLPDGKSYYNNKMFANENEYLKGNNKNIAVIAIQEPSDFNYKTHIAHKPINEIPNIINWNKVIKKIEKADANLCLEKNDIYILAINYLFEKDLILKMQHIASKYNEERKNISKKIKNRQTIINKLRKRYINELAPIQHELMIKIKTLIKYIFKDHKSC